MKKIFIILFMFMTIGLFAEGEMDTAKESVSALMGWGYGISEMGRYEGTDAQDIQEYFPGGVLTNAGWFTNGDDISAIMSGRQYVVKVVHKNLGPVILTCPDDTGFYYIDDYETNSFFLKIEKQYFKREDYFDAVEFKSERGY